MTAAWLLPDDNLCYTSTMKEDYTLDALLDLDGFVAEIGQGFWVKIEARRVEHSYGKPFGIKYSLTLHSMEGERILGIDNAHAFPGATANKAHDHIHISKKMKQYSYKDAATLLEDFWKQVDIITNMGEN